VAHKIEGVKLGYCLPAGMLDNILIALVILNAVKDPDLELVFLDSSPCSE
jgi:hypothetical protein